MKPRLIPNAAAAWRMWSVRMAGLLVAWGALDVELQGAIVAAIGIPAERVPAVLGLLVILARVIDQGIDTPKESEP